MPFTLQPLPFAPEALDPYVSARTLAFHHGKHHQTYVNNLNALIKETPFDTMPLDAIIRATAGDASKAGIFNNAAQTWNHDFFWHSMKPNGGGAPTGALAAMIDKAFGSFEFFKDQFKQAGATQFGSGWVWLVAQGQGVAIVKTANAMTPMAEGGKPLLTCDVWEHAYYLDYQNRRPDFLQAFLDHLVNWDFAAQNL